MKAFVFGQPPRRLPLLQPAAPPPRFSL